jgi:cytochrome P450
VGTVTDRPATFNPFDETYQGWQRHATLETIREQEPPIAFDVLGRPWLFRYHDVNTVLLDRERFLASETLLADSLGFVDGPFRDFLAHQLLTQNPPDHTRIRRAAGYFSRHLVKGLEPAIRQACNRLIDAFPDEGNVEFSHDFAFKLPVGVIMRMMNLPESDEDLIGEWSPKLLPADITADAIAATNEANQALRDYAVRITEDRRKAPIDDDIITDLVAAQHHGDLTHDELWSLIVALIVAGHETTTGALTLGLHTLLHHPDQWERLRADRALLAGATEEILRYEPPVDGVLRIPTEDVEVHGVPISAGSVVNLSPTAANRDPRQFSEPDVFDIARPNARQHLTFTAGIHRCIGAPLAQLEIAIALDALLNRLETIEPVGQPTLYSGAFRRLSAMPIFVKRRS